jgi:hypothetical protein
MLTCAADGHVERRLDIKVERTMLGGRWVYES